MKEDIFVAPFLIPGLAALVKLLQDPTPLRALLTGAYAGLAGGANISARCSCRSPSRQFISCLARATNGASPAWSLSQASPFSFSC
jgi:hypothetical protein